MAFAASGRSVDNIIVLIHMTLPSVIFYFIWIMICRFVFTRSLNRLNRPRLSLQQTLLSSYDNCQVPQLKHMALWSHRLIGGLRRLLSDNELTGTVPTELGAMTAMVEL